MTFPNGSRALLAVALGAVLSAGCTRIVEHQGYPGRRAARHRDPARRRQSRFGDRHARPADLRRPVRPARLVLCLARHPPARLQHAAPLGADRAPHPLRRQRQCRERQPHRPRAGRQHQPEQRQDADPGQPPQPARGAVRQYRRGRPAGPRRADHRQPERQLPASDALLRTTRPAASTASVTRSDAVADIGAIWTCFSIPTSIGPITASPPSSLAAASPRCWRSAGPA